MTASSAVMPAGPPANCTFSSRKVGSTVMGWLTAPSEAMVFSSLAPTAQLADTSTQAMAAAAKRFLVIM